MPGAIPARALQRVTRQVAVLARRRVEAVGNVAAEGRDLVGVARVRTGAHVEIAAHRGGVEVRAARQLPLEVHIARGAARAHRARAVERHHQRPAHRSGLQLPGPVLQVHIPAHRAHVQPRRLAMALELDVAAHALELQVRAAELCRDVTAHRVQALHARHAGRSHIRAHRRDGELAVLRDLHVQVGLAAVPRVRQHDLDGGAAVIGAHVHALHPLAQLGAHAHFRAVPATHDDRAVDVGNVHHAVRLRRHLALEGLVARGAGGRAGKQYGHRGRQPGEAHAQIPLPASLAAWMSVRTRISSW